MTPSQMYDALSERYNIVIMDFHNADTGKKRWRIHLSEIEGLRYEQTIEGATKDIVIHAAYAKLFLHIPKEVGEGDDAWIWYSGHGPGSHWMPKTEVGGSNGYVHYDEDSGEYTIDGTYTKGQVINFARLIDIDPELKPPTEE